MLNSIIQYNITYKTIKYNITRQKNICHITEHNNIAQNNTFTRVLELKAKYMYLFKQITYYMPYIINRTKDDVMTLSCCHITTHNIK